MRMKQHRERTKQKKPRPQSISKRDFSLFQLYDSLDEEEILMKGDES
jgi:hypothetical protein